MLATSFLFPIAAHQAYAYECYDLAFMVCLTFLVSINYWRSPKRGLRRNIDVANAVFVGFYQLVSALMYLDNDGMKFAVLGTAVTIPYFMSRYARDRGRFDWESVFHCGMHLYGTVVCCMFYPALYEDRQRRLQM